MGQWIAEAQSKLAGNNVLRIHMYHGVWGFSQCFWEAGRAIRGHTNVPAAVACSDTRPRNCSAPAKPRPSSCHRLPPLPAGQGRIRDPVRLAHDFDLVGCTGKGRAAHRTVTAPARHLCPQARASGLPSLAHPPPLPPPQVVTTYATLGADFGGKKNGGANPLFPPLVSSMWAAENR